LINAQETRTDKYGAAVLDACREAELMYSMPVENPAALREISVALTLWSMNPQLASGIRIEAGETEQNTARQAAAGSPSDYIAWVTLARIYAVMNSWDTADIYLDHARSLAAPGMPVRMFIRKER
jgi:hypothetical protein